MGGSSQYISISAPRQSIFNKHLDMARKVAVLLLISLVANLTFAGGAVVGSTSTVSAVGGAGSGNGGSSVYKQGGSGVGAGGAATAVNTANNIARGVRL